MTQTHCQILLSATQYGAFRVTPQPRVPPEEARVAVATESSTSAWTAMDRWTYEP
ncbi:hypothetical protein M8C21_018996 [Ambrosia artemisiifolia]|uniref:Ribulose bisphosphate carboxylase large chain n=1 Tax=Ambrosia artemisiifolia TaxID=4212 RepID=A0AAD5CW73_AMBAR|nr:hypothetical protein M8C21_018996 [Ambrosia artemisiifolia]